MAGASHTRSSAWRTGRARPATSRICAWFSRWTSVGTSRSRTSRRVARTLHRGSRTAVERPDCCDGRMSCADLIQYHPEELKQAFWSIKALDVYQWRPLPPPGAEFDASTATPTTEAPPSFVQVGVTAGAGGSAGLPPGADLSSPAALRHEAMDRSLPAPTVPPEMSKVSISDRDRPSFGFMQARGDTSIPPFVARAAAWMGSAIAGATALVLLLVIIRVASGSRQSESDRQVVMHLNDSDSCNSCRTQSGLD
mmetsp:Transcript_60570/g.196249  ORF Transcript_60570/g.196249 Transcript_60570/m.196249 type:complete len:253 (+) Transcript_60570:971-1729(+)